MSPITRARPSPTAVIAGLALFVALGSVAVAAKKNKAPRNTVVSSSIQRNAVRSADISNKNGVKAKDIVDGAVRSEQILDGSLDTPELSNSIPAARVTGAQQDIPHLDFVALAFNLERYDTRNMHTNNAPRNTRLFAPVTGIYVVSASIMWGSGIGAAFHIVKLERTNLVGRRRALAHESTDEGFVHRQTITTVARLEAGDYVEVFVFSSNPQGAIDRILRREDFSPEFSMTWLAPGP